jgi:hypothetical protein
MHGQVGRPIAPRKRHTFPDCGMDRRGMLPEDDPAYAVLGDDEKRRLEADGRVQECLRAAAVRQRARAILAAPDPSSALRDAMSADPRFLALADAILLATGFADPAPGGQVTFRPRRRRT